MRVDFKLCLLSCLLITVALGNAITEENAKPGTPNWQITNLVGGGPTRDSEIAGFGAAMSVNAGASLPIKIHRAGGRSGSFSLDVYRLGYYSGAGARQLLHAGPLHIGPQASCVEAEIAARLIDCSAWPVGYTLQTTPEWISGFYLVKLTDESGRQAYVFFVVRNDRSSADLVVQIAFNCAQAYNDFGGYSLYEFNSLNGDRAYKVSYDRPFMQGLYGAADFSNPLRFEYAMIYWLESEGYSTTYISSTDFQDSEAILRALDSTRHKAFLSVGHDEYWSLEERQAIQGARDRPHPLNLGFFSANTAYWRVRFDSSPSTGEPNRTMICYKDQWLLDPAARSAPTNATNQFRSLQNNLPENGLLGVMYNGDFSQMGLARGNDYQVVANAAGDPYFGSTGLKAGSTIKRLVGFEWDSVVNNARGPQVKVLLQSSFGNLEDVGQDMGNHPLFTNLQPKDKPLSLDKPLEAGFLFESDTPGLISSIRYWRAPGDWGIHFGRIWTAGESPEVVALTKFEHESPRGWQRSPVIPPVHIEAHRRYIAAVNSNGLLAQIGGGLASPTRMGHLTALAVGGVTGELAGYPGSPATATNYLRDIDFIPDHTVNVYSANAVRYVNPNGAKVVSVGSINWAWGLATPPAGVPYIDPNPRVDTRVIKFTENALADLGAHPQAEP